jgi:hypothetical protein
VANIMFDFFKRSTPTKTAEPRTQPAKRRSANERARYDPMEPLPKPEVTEGNEDSDWSLWENSVAFQDSQMSDTEPYPKTMPAPLAPEDTGEAGDSILSTGYDTVRSTDL